MFQTFPFGECPSGFLSVLALAMKIAELDPKESVLTEDEYGESFSLLIYRHLVSLFGYVSVYFPGGSGLIPRRINTQGLNLIIEEKVLPLL